MNKPFPRKEEHNVVVDSIVQVFNASLSIVMLPIGTLGIDNNVEKLSYRIIILFTCLFGALVYWSYCAILVSLLTVSSSRLPINRLEDLLNKSGYSLGIMAGTAAYNYFSKADQETNLIAYEIFQKYFNASNQIGNIGIKSNTFQYWYFYRGLIQKK